MAIPLIVVGATFEYPENFDEDWGVNATGWAQAVTNGMLQRSGGNFPLTADANFGGSFGLVSLYYKGHSSNIATAGTVRLSSADAGIAFRNNANTGNLILTTNSSDVLLYNGTPIGTSGGLTNSHIFVGNASNVQTDVAMSGDVHIDNAGATTIQAGVITDAKVSASAAIALTKLAATTASRALVSDGSGFISPSAVTSAELGFSSGVTSAIQTQLNARLPLAGGTMSGAIAMGANKITGLANGTAAQDAITFSQLFSGFQSIIQTTSSTAFSTTSSTYQNTHLSLSITPTSSSHRIRLTVGGDLATSNGSATSAILSITRNGTDLTPGTNGFAIASTTGTNINIVVDNAGVTYIDSPATTSALTYVVVIKNTDNATSISFGGGSLQVMTAEEIV